MSAERLWQTARGGDISAVRRLLDAGANPNEYIMPGSGLTALYGAVRHIDIMELLVSRGANPLLGYVSLLSGQRGNLMDALAQANSPCMRGGVPTADPAECSDYIADLLDPWQPPPPGERPAELGKFVSRKRQALYDKAWAEFGAAHQQRIQATLAAQAAQAASAAQAAEANSPMANNSWETLTEATANTGENQTGAMMGGRRTRPRTRRRRQHRRRSYRRKRRR